MGKCKAVCAMLLLLVPQAAVAQVTGDAPGVRPDAIVDLKTDEGVALVKGQWRYRDARVIEVDHHGPGADLAPSGPPNRTQDIDLHAGAADFDDSTWERLTPAQLEERRSTGRLCFNWYRTSVTIPDRIGSFDPAGSTVVFEIAIDDYAEIWVDGKLPLVLGQPGGHVIKGFNTPNRVVLTGHARPGQKIQLAVFGINGPLSHPPGNFIWVRSAVLDFYKTHRVGPTQFVRTEIVQTDPALDHLVAPGTQLEKLAGGFLFTEGPVWVPATAKASGYLLFSDPNANTIYRWSPEGQVSVFRTKSGYSGFDVGEYHQPGSNGLTLDRQGRLTINQHGNRRVIRVEPRGNITVLADRYGGKRLNSPNDLVYRSDGALFFTDPPFGLPQTFNDLRKELPYSGVYCVKDGEVKLVSTDLDAPNGIALSPDEQTLYVNNWNDRRKVILRYDVNPDCTLANGRLFHDMTQAPGNDALDGLKVDQEGHVYSTGPGGLWILSPDGRQLGLIKGPEDPHNMAWGDDDGKALYITAQTGIYRIRMNVAGVRP
ncbi:SMP-30/gluconolactonase/LRE family protein [Nitrospira moscoviensis]|uniref:Gluconolactonase n=1 Tax=Nitrospira moscoviensis TaxID=42253 RepID=A0A0K2GHT6_NITMO|nr:SMP-30/gluconolactonase/LRE family protein [Nitrospira moscoviensis]ALA60404.1 Gluconolactonase [Nitrospira moscoviensis]